MVNYPNPIVVQRADPWVIRERGRYYFTASHPAYDRIIVREATHLADLQGAEEFVVWRKHDEGPMSRYIWAPELHRIGDIWYIYFAAAQTSFVEGEMPGHRMYVLECLDDDPCRGRWIERGQILTPLDTFSLDATTAEIDGVLYLIWAQHDPAISGHSNIYIAQMENPWTLASEPTMLTHPEYDWECVDFEVNEAPAVLQRDDDIYLTYSASGTGVPYAVGMLRAKRGANLLDAASWVKSPRPVFATCAENGQYGPGHNSFTVSEDGEHDLIIYHARNYTDIVGDPLFDPNRHARVGEVEWSENGPRFGVPQPDTRPTPRGVEILDPTGVVGR